MRQEQLAVSVKHIPYKSRLHQQIISNFKQRLRASKDEKRKKREEEWEK